MKEIRMKLKTLAMLALAGIATRLYIKPRGSAAAGARVDHGDGPDTTPAWRPSDIAESSPNLAERMGDSGLGQDLLPSPSQRSDDPVTPGVPDLPRGA
jgi:hypothetical protein